MSLGYKYHVCPFEDGTKYAITEIEYGKDKIKAPNIPIDENKLDLPPYDSDYYED